MKKQMSFRLKNNNNNIEVEGENIPFEDFSVKANFPIFNRGRNPNPKDDLRNIQFDTSAQGYSENIISQFEFNHDTNSKLPCILDDMSLAFSIGVHNRLLWYVAKKAKLRPLHNGEDFDAAAPSEKLLINEMYTMYKIPKPGKNEFRVIYEPSESIPFRSPLKTILKAMNAFLFDEFEWPEYVDAYVIGKSVHDSAKKHVAAKTAIFLDIKNFFPSIRHWMIRDAFSKIFGYNRQVADLLGLLCSVNGILPQGSPIASSVANLVALHRFDEKIRAALPNGWTYSRYSDDIILSSKEDVDDNTVEIIKSAVCKIINSAGFKINQKKIRVAGKGPGRLPSLQWLGFVLNEKLNSKQHQYMRMRQLLYYASLHGFADQAERLGEDPEKHKAMILGQWEHMRKALDPARVDKLSSYIEQAKQVDYVKGATKDLDYE